MPNSTKANKESIFFYSYKTGVKKTGVKKISQFNINTLKIQFTKL